MNLRDIFLAGAFAQGGGGAVSPEQITEAVNSYLDKNPVGVDLAMTGAAVGQIAKITAVDASGVPTAWEPVDMPSGGGGEEWEQITAITLEDSTVGSISESFEHEYRKILLLAATGSSQIVTGASSMERWTVFGVPNANANSQKISIFSKMDAWTNYAMVAEHIGDNAVLNYNSNPTTTFFKNAALGNTFKGITIKTGNAEEYFFNPITFYIYGVRA